MGRCPNSVLVLELQNGNKKYNISQGKKLNLLKKETR